MVRLRQAYRITYQIIGMDPYIPNMDLTMTGNGIAYVAPILPVNVITTEQMRNPKKTIGMVSRAVKPNEMTLETTLASGGANMSDVQYAQ
jgi:hypothetical protein